MFLLFPVLGGYGPYGELVQHSNNFFPFFPDAFPPTSETTVHGACVHGMCAIKKDSRHMGKGT